MRFHYSIIKIFWCILFSTSIYALTAQSTSILIEDVQIFDGKSKKLLEHQNVLIEGNIITQISSEKIEVKPETQKIAGKGKTLMPGLIDVHVHMIFGGLSMADLMNPNLDQRVILEKTSVQSERMLMRGFTAVRDVGGPVFPLKAAIDQEKVKGPRIWPSGATISQTSGHGDFRLPHELSRRFHGQLSRAESMGATFIADGTADILVAVRENLRLGASHIKLMAGGGTSSAYDPVDVTQYTLEEMKAAVEAAEDWGTYVTVHAYTPRAVGKAIEAGVRCVEHGQLLDKKTLKLMKKNNVWLSCQNLIESSENMDPMRRLKRQPVIEGQKRLWPMAKKMKLKLAWGTDFLFEPELNERQNEFILALKEWFTPYEILKMVTHDNAQLLALSGLRSPYLGKLGVVEEGALADLLLVNGNPLENIDLIGNPEDNFQIIIKDGKIYKNTLP